MRKADYQTLATLIRTGIFNAKNYGDKNARIDSLTSLALEFVSKASVDREAFLKACGIA